MKVFGFIVASLIMIGCLIWFIFSLKDIIYRIKHRKDKPKQKKLTRKQRKKLQQKINHYLTQEEQQANEEQK